MIGPQPTSAIERGGAPLARQRSASAAPAAVRLALISVPSTMATGRPVAASLTASIAEARSPPAETFATNDATHFTPTNGRASSMLAGMAKKRPPPL